VILHANAAARIAAPQGGTVQSIETSNHARCEYASHEKMRSADVDAYKLDDDIG